MPARPHTPAIRITHHPGGRRVYILDRRLHHGLVGFWLCCAGLALVLHDWSDAPWPTQDPPQ